ncbi:class III lanthionine synthetase LanKC [Archangium primigenium]|uniref:class III lanthionine synthetase LanKC n=1 Tax=[Archangium] primigenium TaxID=2792470 RepID=UPI0019596411|nr:class III lanthionine synthetase LanKC [Archangium primigenium]MBM7116771.1 class III lanthionine synthetase LanKC [Archangium primigenium]
MADGSFFYAFLDPEYFETIERYQPDAQYLDIVKRHVDDSWHFKPGGYWTHCWREASRTRLEQGWKIHLAAAEETAQEVLERTVPVLVGFKVAFKFCADPTMLRLSLNKNAPRTGAGKFVTVYPDTEADFKTQLEALHEATRDLWGPYLLTDRPYNGSKVVFYRYGTHWAREQVNHRGQRLSGMLAPDGTFVEDERVPVFKTPAWVKDPFPPAPAPVKARPAAPAPKAEAPDSAPTRPAPAAKKGAGTLLNNRYRVESAFKFNTSGGIYAGTDTQTGAAVVIREARPLTSKDPDKDEAFQLLAKQARILQRLGDTGLTPRFVDLFQHWEHRFLVEEKLDAETLWGYAIGFSRASPDLRVSHFFTRMRDTVLKIARGLKTIHEHGVVLRDLTRSNIMFTSDQQVKFIDLEFAFELDRDEPFVRSWTDGHSSPEQRRWERPKPGDDCYSLGAMILDQIVFTAPGLDINREGILQSFKQSLEDYHLPLEVYDIVLGLLEQDPAKRWDTDRVIAAFSAIPVPQHDAPLVPMGDVPPPRAPPPEGRRAEIANTLEGISRFILAKADYSRTDRLWPTQGTVYGTNPLNLDYGAAGTAAFLQRQNGQVPAPVVDWMLQRLEGQGHRYPPGLYSGLGGIAMVLQEIGQTAAAREAMETAARSELLHQKSDLYWGDAGWGLANLHFWRHTGEEKYLTRASEAAEYLLSTKQESAKGASWVTDGETRLGFGHGQAGVALFLIYLAQVKQDARYLDTAVKALDFEIAHCQVLSNMLLWYPHVDARPSEPKSPHMRFGTSGIGTSMVRAYVATGETRLRAFADRCANTVSDRHSNKLWFNYGISGYGEFLLDMYRLLGGEEYLNCAHFLAEGILPHRIEREEGIAFASEELFRISCDLGGGSAGIGMFLHRLLHPEQPRFMMLDELLVSNAAGAKGPGLRTGS